MRIWATAVVLVFMFPSMVAASSMAGDTDWPQYRADNQNTGAIGYGGGGTGELMWERWFTVAGGIDYSPIFVGCGPPSFYNDIIYSCSIFYESGLHNDWFGKLVAFDANVGEALWAYEANHGITTPKVAHGLLYLEIPNGVVALDSRTGSLEWEVNIEGNGTGVTIYDGIMYVSTDSRSQIAMTYAIDAKNGDILWSSPNRGSNIIVEDNRVILTSSRGLTALDVLDGKLLWENEFHSYSKAAIWDGVLVWTSRSYVLAIGLVSGDELWREELPHFSTTGSGRTPVIYEGVAYVVSEKILRGHDVYTGEVVVEEEMEFYPMDDPVVINDTMYLRSIEGDRDAMRGDAVFWAIHMNTWDVQWVQKIESRSASGFSVAYGYLYAIAYDGLIEDRDEGRSYLLTLDVGRGASEVIRQGEVTEIEWRTAPWLEEESQNDGFTTDDFEEMFNQTRNQTRPGGSGSNEAPFVGVPVLLVVVLVCLVSWRRRLL